jgi:hypothetical protein
MFRWEHNTPFGSPVEPEVNSTYSNSFFVLFGKVEELEFSFSKITIGFKSLDIDSDSSNVDNTQSALRSSIDFFILYDGYLIDNGANAFPLIRQPIIADITLPLLPTNNGIVTGF